MLILDPQKLQVKLQKIRPIQVAVAYVGANWKDYLLDVEALEEVIVSPTLGKGEALLLDPPPTRLTRRGA